MTIATSVDSKTITLTGSSFAWQTFVVDCASSDYVKLTTTGLPDMRYMKVYAGDLTEVQLKASETGDEAYRVITGITDKSYTVTGLTENGFFYYYVMANYTDGTAANSNTEEVTLFGSTPAYQLGDVDHDGSVNIADVTQLIDYLLDNSIEIYLDSADVDPDGEINIADVTALIDLLLKTAD